MCEHVWTHDRTLTFSGVRIDEKKIEARSHEYRTYTIPLEISGMNGSTDYRIPIEIKRKKKKKEKKYTHKARISKIFSFIVDRRDLSISRAMWVKKERKKKEIGKDAKWTRGFSAQYSRQRRQKWQSYVTLRCGYFNLATQAFYYFSRGVLRNLPERSGSSNPYNRRILPEARYSPRTEEDRGGERERERVRKPFPTIAVYFDRVVAIRGQYTFYLFFLTRARINV